MLSHPKSTVSFRSFSFTSIGWGFCIVALLISVVAMAANVNEFEYPEVRQVSGEASAASLEGVAYVFQALEAAERGNFDRANEMKANALTALQRSEEGFRMVAKQMKPRKIDIAKLSKLMDWQSVRRALEDRHYKVPSTTTDLAQIAWAEIVEYRHAVSELTFGKDAKARAQVLHMSQELSALMYLGVAVSEYADAAE